MRWFLPELVWTGVSISFWSGLLIPMMACQLRKEYPGMNENE